MTSNFLNRARHLAALLGVLILTIHPAFAETVEVKLPTGIIATADFRAGQPSRPVVLLLHGFLQTRNAPPMSSLANTLLYVAKFAEAVYVLHAFEKKSQRTLKIDIDLANQRYRLLLQERKK